MRNSLKDFRALALARANVRREYDALAKEFELLNESLKVRAAAGLSRAEVASPDQHHSTRYGAAIV